MSIASPMRLRVHRADLAMDEPGTIQRAEDGEDAAGAVDVFDVVVCDDGATLQMFGTRCDRRSMSLMVNGTPASCAMARMCSTVLVEPPMAMSSVMAFSNASKVAMLRGSTLASPST